MQKFMSLGIILFAALFMATPAQASGDYGCYPEWKINLEWDNVFGTGCGGVAVLTPGNDTRTNMILLLADIVPPTSNFKYPDPYGYEGQGRNFFGWNILGDSLYPRPNERTSHSYFGGTRCQSYHSGTELFKEQLRAAKIKPEEQSALIKTRESLFAICAGPEKGSYSYSRFSDAEKKLARAGWINPSNKISSKTGQDFLTYLLAAKAFYGEDFASANNLFAELTKSSNSWLKETAIYMIGRTELNRAQVSAFGNWGEFEGPESIDKKAITNSGEVFTAYINNFPKGRYTSSAKGLMRRVFWLSGDDKGLANAYDQALTQTSNLDPDAFAIEADTKLFFNEKAIPHISDPRILAVIALKNMRSKSYGEKPISRSELEKQKAAFSSNPALYEYLLASHALQVEGDARKVLQLIPDAARQENFSYLQFSRQALRGMALAKLNDRNEEGFWRDMIAGARKPYQRPFVELGLARNLEKKGEVAKVFAAGSPVQDGTIRAILLQNSVGPVLLRAVSQDSTRPAHERDVALFTLLYKQLATGDYAGYVQDAKLLPANAPEEYYIGKLHTMEVVPLRVFSSDKVMSDYVCPKFAATAAALAKNNNDFNARLCLGEFIRLNGFDNFSLDNEQPKEGALGSGPTNFKGGNLGRQKIYTDIIAAPRASADVKSYALYRAVNCYATSGNNSCGGKDVDISQRKAWFQQLKNSYPDSRWAKDLKYYW